MLFSPSSLQVTPFRRLSMKIFTLGYEKISFDVYTHALINANVKILIDVRERAWSQRPEFIKSSLKRGLAQSGIQYVHIPSAGNPSINRKTARSAAECMRRYHQYLKSNPECLGEILSYIKYSSEKGFNACLTCYERDPNYCHRSVLIKELLRVEPEIMPIHLQPSQNIEKARLVEDSPSLLKTAFLTPALLPIE